MKITLKNLHEATAQQVFDQIAIHLLTQNAVSYDYFGNCRYHGFNSLKCAAGCLIADDEYNSNMEAKSWGELVDIGYVNNSHQHLITALQRCHDSFFIPKWKERLYEIAEEFDLEMVKL